MSFPRYPKYKPSGVEWLGEVPKHWERSALKRLGSYENGYPYKPDERGDEGLPIIRISQLTSEDPPAFFGGDVEGHVPIKDGDLLFAWSASIDAFIWRRGPALLNQHIFKVTPALGVDKQYLFHLIRHVAPKLADFDAHGSTMRHIKKESLGEVAFFPPLPEQRAIAAFLDRETDKIDGLIAEQERLIELLKEKRQAVISHAVTKGLDPAAPMKPSGVEWLGEVPEHWVVSRLGYEAWVRARLGWKGLKAEEYVDDGYVFLSTPNIKPKEIDFVSVNYIDQTRFDESPEIQLRVGDVLLAKDGSTLGTVNVVRQLPRAATVNSSIAVITPGVRADSVFMYYLFESAYMDGTIQRIKGGMGVPHLFQEDLNRFHVPLPPIPEQRAIAAFLDRETAKIDGLVNEAQSAITLLTERRSALISAAVTGQIDVRTAVHKETA
jgi:type I restriction enzyme S subunit